MTTKIKNMPSIIGFKDLRLNADKYINAIARGKSFTVVRRSRPIFNIIPIDEWGDEGVWETVADFRDKNGKGIKSGNLLKLLEKIG
jgi:prevent-host-death family protein